MAKVMTIRPTDEMREQIKDKARKRGYTVNQLVLQILWNWLEQQKGR